MNRIKELRKNKRISLRELAEKTNYSHSQISRIENGFCSISDDLIYQLCSFFDVTSDYLLGISNKRTSFQGIVFENEEGKQIIIDPGLFIPNKILVVNEKKLLKITDLDNPTKENIFKLKK